LAALLAGFNMQRLSKGNVVLSDLQSGCGIFILARGPFERPESDNELASQGMASQPLYWRVVRLLVVWHNQRPCLRNVLNGIRRQETESTLEATFPSSV
jgi:hypothetical protein